jgi:hypothetical protein
MTMNTPETTAEWAKRDPQRSFIECAERLQDQDHSVDALADAMMAIALTMQNKLHGPQWVAARLAMLADAAAARRASDEARDATSH